MARRCPKSLIEKRFGIMDDINNNPDIKMTTSEEFEREIFLINRRLDRKNNLSQFKDIIEHDSILDSRVR